MIHNDYKYKPGLNVLDQKFNPSGDCEGGGLYVTWRACHFFSYGSLIADVTLPPDADVWTMPDKLKASAIILTNIRPIVKANFDWPYLYACNYINWEFVKAIPGIDISSVYEEAQNIVDGDSRKYYQNLANARLHGKLPEKGQTYKMCLDAVKRDGLALQFVADQTLDICMEAVKNNNKAIMYVKTWWHKFLCRVEIP